MSAYIILFAVGGTVEHHIGCKLEQNFVNDPTAVFDVSLGVNGFMYRVDFVNMSQTNVSAAGHRQRRLHRGDPPLDLDRYIGWKSLKETYLLTSTQTDASSQCPFGSIGPRRTAEEN